LLIFTTIVVVQGVDPEHRGVRGVPHPPAGCAPHHRHHHVSHGNSTPRKTQGGQNNQQLEISQKPYTIIQRENLTKINYVRHEYQYFFIWLMILKKLPEVRNAAKNLAWQAILADFFQRPNVANERRWTDRRLLTNGG
jgi:hypothetical protein